MCAAGRRNSGSSNQLHSGYPLQVLAAFRSRVNRDRAAGFPLLSGLTLCLQLVKKPVKICSPNSGLPTPDYLCTVLLTDTHAHLYSSKFSADRDDMIQRALRAGAQRLFLPAIDSESHNDLLELADRYPENCFPMMGLHPTSVAAESFEKEISIVEDYFSKRKFFAVGEIGIDLYWDKTQADLQKKVFAHQVDLAKKLNLPVVIHSRNAFNECYEIVKEKQDGTLKGVFHCFADGIAQAEKVIALGNFWMGIGGVVTYKNSGLDKIVEAIDLQHFVLETDAPYLTPVPFRGQRNESSYIVHVAKKISEIKNISVEEVARITTENSTRLFSA